VSNEPVSSWIEHEAEISRACWSADGTRVVTASHDRTVRISDARSGDSILQALEHPREVLHVALDRTGARVITASADGVARVWSVAQDRDDLITLDHAKGWLNKVAFDARADRVVTAGKDGTARIWSVASGELLARYTAGDRAIWWYLEREPMATELAQLAVGALTVTSRGHHDGVLVRDVTPTRLTAGLEPKLALEISQLDWLRERLGEYPFRTYGSLVVDASIGFALETQTLSLYEARFFDFPPQFWGPLIDASGVRSTCDTDATRWSLARLSAAAAASRTRNR
jgi:hypothetical protein